MSRSVLAAALVVGWGMSVSSEAKASDVGGTLLSAAAYSAYWSDDASGCDILARLGDNTFYHVQAFWSPEFGGISEAQITRLLVLASGTGRLVTFTNIEPIPPEYPGAPVRYNFRRGSGMNVGR